MGTAQVIGHSATSASTRTVILASTDAALRARLRSSLNSLRWQVREASGGAEALVQLEQTRAEALMLDSWLPDLDISEFVGQVRSMHPAIDLVHMDGTAPEDTVHSGGTRIDSIRSPRRNELLHALREAQESAPRNDTAVWATAALSIPRGPAVARNNTTSTRDVAAKPSQTSSLTGLIGNSAGMTELASLIRLVAPRSTSVLIEGETGTGKEVVARALHRLSLRSSKPFVVLNCAAIPESLLEAELFGHTRGAFTGAVQARTGRIEAAHGGTLFLDEIGEMPLALQAKMLRFLECGELQRVGDNETLRVDVRVIAATHQPLARRAADKTFRLDLYHRLAVFPLDVPPLRERPEDIELLVEHFLAEMGRDAPRKRISPQALLKLRAYAWPGNVRELMHILERGIILAEDRLELQASDIRFGRISTSD